MVNPDEAVAAGAASQGSSVVWRPQRRFIVDRYPPVDWALRHSVGVMTKMDHKNTTIPTRFSQSSRPADDKPAGFTIKSVSR